ncbi:MAG: hypothetical protein AB8G96_15815 [Phycisphaerales bacterium]
MRFPVVPTSWHREHTIWLFGMFPAALFAAITGGAVLTAASAFVSDLVDDPIGIMFAILFGLLLWASIAIANLSIWMVIRRRFIAWEPWRQWTALAAQWTIGLAMIAPCWGVPFGLAIPAIFLIGAPNAAGGWGGRERCCGRCGYERRGSIDQCPECGHGFAWMADEAALPHLMWLASLLAWSSVALATVFIVWPESIYDGHVEDFAPLLWSVPPAAVAIAVFGYRPNIVASRRFIQRSMLIGAVVVAALVTIGDALLRI